MNINIRKNRDYNKVMSFKQLWLQEQFQKLRKVYDPSEVSNNDLKDLLLAEYDKRRIVSGRLFSNTTNKNEAMTQEQFLDYFLNKPIILSGYSTLYENQDNSTNIGSAALKFLLDSRKIYKKKMEESEYGSDQYIYYRILQLTFKVLANSYYGILGERNSVFYNPHVQNSITMTGQDLIMTTILSLENYLADNVKFDNFDDCLTFINESLSEKIDDQILKYLDEPVFHSDLVEYLINKTTNFDILMKPVLEKTIQKLNMEDVNRLYYKNKVLDFVKNSWVKNRFQELVEKLNSQSDENIKNIKSELDEFAEIVKTFTFSNMIFEDRYKRVMKMQRKNVVVSDTDSAFINLSNYIRDTFQILNVENNENNELIIMNMYIDIVTKALDSTMNKITENMGLLEEYKPIINLKNEFVYKRIMLTRNKKSYAGIITSELGKSLKKPVSDIKGLSIRKSSVAKVLRKKFTQILEEDVLKAPKVNLSKIIKKFDELGLEVEQSLRNGETSYLLPKNIENIDGYKDASMQEPVRGALVWNALEPENQIVPPEKVDIIKMKIFDKTDPLLLNLKQTHPDKYNAIMKVVFNEGVDKPNIDISRFGFSVVAVPKSVEKIPSYLLPMIDYQSMVNNNMTNGYIILESLGIYTEEVKTTKYKSNIIEI
jgi:hypothetical protein